MRIITSLLILQTQTLFTTALDLMSLAPLTAYKRSYHKHGQSDVLHEQAFGSVAAVIGGEVPKRVLYPGCHRHITASLVFPHVDYVDCDEKVGSVYTDEKVQEWILLSHHQLQLYQHPPSRPTTRNNKANKVPTWSFTCSLYKDMSQKAQFHQNHYDLMISLSAGIVSEPCHDFLGPGGYLLVNDSHGDASAAFVMMTRADNNATQKVFDLVAAWETDAWNTNDLQDYFQSTNKTTNCPSPITVEQAREAAAIGSKSKRSFRLQKEAPFYLFQKQQSAVPRNTTREDAPNERVARKRRRQN